jgi:SMI1 / KNR4 family (SUKH-1)
MWGFMDCDLWITRWEQALQACRRLGGDARELSIGQPATEQAVVAVEKELKLALPSSLRQTLIGFAAEVEFRWFLPKGIALPEPLRGIFSGECSWSLSRLVELEQSRKDWVEICFPNVEDEYDLVWHNKLAFLPVSNGDLLALDLSLPSAPVIYLSHDDGLGHGYKLGADFADFIDRWTRLGCPGAEDWQMIPFAKSPASLIDPDCENGLLWRSLFGLQ